MVETSQVTVRAASQSDALGISSFLKRCVFIHRHLDWLSPIEWLAYQPYLILEIHHKMQSILVCAPEIAGVYWIRIFANLESGGLHANFHQLCQTAINMAEAEHEKPLFACIANHDWLLGLLIENGWIKIQDVVQLKWNRTLFKKQNYSANPDVSIRPMKLTEIRRVAFIDQASFQPIWQHSEHALKKAFQQSSYSSVCEMDQKVVGYQMSTSFQYRAHIARLAVLPEYQGRQLGKALVLDALKYFKKPWIREITVNTQSNNHRSLSIYHKLGFENTSDQFPIYIYQIQD